MEPAKEATFRPRQTERDNGKGMQRSLHALMNCGLDDCGD
jgi:hypothetical protein